MCTKKTRPNIIIDTVREELNYNHKKSQRRQKKRMGENFIGKFRDLGALHDPLPFHNPFLPAPATTEKLSMKTHESYSIRKSWKQKLLILYSFHCQKETE